MSIRLTKVWRSAAGVLLAGGMLVGCSRVDPLSTGVGRCTDVLRVGLPGVLGVGSRTYNPDCAADDASVELIRTGRQINDRYMIAAGVSGLRESNPRIERNAQAVEAAAANQEEVQCTVRGRNFQDCVLVTTAAPAPAGQ